MPKPVAIMRCMLEENMLAIGLDADHTLGVEGAPCSIACFCLPEITAADDIGFCSGRAGPFDFLTVARVELNAAHHAISLVELHADDAAASVGDEFFNKGSLVHGKKQRGASRPVRQQYHGWYEKGALRPQLHNL